MTGEGIARPEVGAAEIEASLAGVTTPMLARRVAVLADRLDRLAEHDEVATARRVREAKGAGGGEARHRELDSLVASLADEPASAVRRLKGSAAGVDRLLGLWDDLARDLEAGRDWTDEHTDRASRLVGRMPKGLGGSRFEVLAASEGEGRAEALAEIARLIAAEIADLRAHRGTLPPVDPARERAEGAALALFDVSEQGALFRRYEMATERAFYKAIAQVRKAGALDLAEAALAPEASPALGSFGAGPPAEARPVVRPASEASPAVAPPALGSFGAEPPDEPRPTVRPAPTPPPTPTASKPTSLPALPPGTWSIASILPAHWVQDPGSGKPPAQPLDTAPRDRRRPKLPKR